MNRLAGASNATWSETYTYDGFGNLKSKSGTGGTPSMTASYDSHNHYTHVVPSLCKEAANQMDAVLRPAEPVATTVATKPATSAVK